MTDASEKPSRFSASPAQIHAFLQENFAEDVLLHFYRAVGDEVLDEALTHGRHHRGVMESRNCKHLYLSGMADVMDEIWDYRFYPAKLPKMESYTRPHPAPPRTRPVDHSFHPADSTFHPQHTRLPSPKAPVNVFIRETLAGWVAVENDDLSHWVAVDKLFSGLMEKLASLPGGFVVVNPPADETQAPTEPVPAPTPKATPCYITKAHEPHDWLKGRRKFPCPGFPN